MSMQETFDRHVFSFERYSAFTLKHKRHTYRRCRCCLWWLLSYFFHISSLAHKIEFKVPVAYSWLQPPPAVASLSSRKTSVCIRINVRKKEAERPSCPDKVLSRYWLCSPYMRNTFSTDFLPSFTDGSKIDTKCEEEDKREWEPTGSS